MSSGKETSTTRTTGQRHNQELMTGGYIGTNVSTVVDVTVVARAEVSKT